MIIPRYWARGHAEAPDSESGETHATSAYGWSDRSAADALRDANERAARVAEWLAGGQEDESPGHYYGGDRPLREELVREFGAGSARIAAITRNAYGALVLNTAGAMFIDVDHRASAAGCLGRMFGLARPERVLARIRRAVDDSGLAVRVYRTAAGFRCLVTSSLFDPASERADELMRSFEADPAYRTLCRTQRSFRARLTPKPWRCGIARRPPAFPFLDEDAQRRRSEWLRDYERACQGYGVCEFLESLGPSRVDQVVAVLQREHDAVACRPGLPLA